MVLKLTLKHSPNVVADSNDENNFPHKLLLTNTFRSTRKFDGNGFDKFYYLQSKFQECIKLRRCLKVNTSNETPEFIASVRINENDDDIAKGVFDRTGV